jgi:uncharacterized protein YndB with AHSA1/START domain
MKYTGDWRIDEMELWEADYLNTEVEAFISIDERSDGQFQFGLVSGHMDGEVIQRKTETRLEFTWEGNDECDEVAGSGWLQLRDDDTLDGEIKFHEGDRSSLVATRIKS